MHKKLSPIVQYFSFNQMLGEFIRLVKLNKYDFRTHLQPISYFNFTQMRADLLT